jgi:cytochrome P450
VFAVKLLGHGQAIMVADPRCVQHILSDNFENYEKGDLLSELIKPIMGFGIFNSNGDRWRHKRRVALQLFTARRMDHMSRVFCKHLRTMMVVLDGHVHSGEEFDLQDLLFRFTLDSICEIAFGKSIHSIEHGATDFSRAFDVVGVHEAELSDPTCAVSREGVVDIVTD